MKKILVMSAFMAFSAAFVACSSNDDLVQQKPDVPEETTVGYPMHVSVADTRGTDLTKATLPGFTMYSAMQKDNATDWQTGVAFTNNNGNCSKVTLADTDFPDNTNTYYFFAISDPDNIADIAENEGAGDGYKDVPVISNNGQTLSFNYAVPTDYTTYAEGKEIKAANITGGQKDLLVATATGNGADGEVSLTFDHALALVKKVYIRANFSRICTLLGYTNIDPDDVDNDLEVREELANTYEYKVGESMAICDAFTAGTYTFGSGWSGQAVRGEFNIPITASAFHPFDDEWYEIPVTAGDDGLYLLPQTFDGSLVDNGDNTFTLSGAYIKVGLQVFAKSPTYNEDHEGTYYLHGWSPSDSSAPGTTDSDKDSLGDPDDPTHFGNGFRPFYVPLTFEILPNKAYNIRIDLTRGCYLSADDNTTLYALFSGMDVTLSN